jgi:hypothetical protein
LQRESHILLAKWAADCAERVIHLFEAKSDDLRPRRAIEVGRAWANNQVRSGVAMKASVAAHAAARTVTDKAVVAAARAAGHAVATAHFADHSMGALIYALIALAAAGESPDAELQMQIARLPEHLRCMVSEGILSRLGKLRILRSARSPSISRSL